MTATTTTTTTTATTATTATATMIHASLNTTRAHPNALASDSR